MSQPCREGYIQMGSTGSAKSWVCGQYEYTISIQVADDKIEGFDPIAYGWTNAHCPTFTIIAKQTNLQLA